MNACQMRIMRDDVEYQCVTEDSKTRVYLSVMRVQDEDKLRKELNERQRERVKKKIIEWLKSTFKEVAIMCFAVLSGVVTYLKLAEKMRIVRGYDAIGGEILFACVVVVLAYYLAHFLLNMKGREV